MDLLLCWHLHFPNLICVTTTKPRGIVRSLWLSEWCQSLMKLYCCIYRPMHSKLSIAVVEFFTCFPAGQNPAAVELVGLQELLHTWVPTASIVAMMRLCVWGSEKYRLNIYFTRQPSKPSGSSGKSYFYSLWNLELNSNFSSLFCDLFWWLE